MRWGDKKRSERERGKEKNKRTQCNETSAVKWLFFLCILHSSLTNLCTRALLCDCAMVNIVLKSDKSDRGWGWFGMK